MQKSECTDFRGQPKAQDFEGKYKSGHVSGEASSLHHILLVLQLFWESTGSCPVCPHPAGGSRAWGRCKHWKVFSECWSPEEAPSAMSRAQLPRACTVPRLGEIPVGGCPQAVGKQWQRSTCTLTKAELLLWWFLCAWGAEMSLVEVNHRDPTSNRSHQGTWSSIPTARRAWRPLWDSAKLMLLPRARLATRISAWKE